jgi:uncharacterized membrane protein YeaQ/YmgE (transglycosylase-associated protein family)
MRTVSLSMLVGAILGAAVASAVVPPALGWYNEPGNISPGSPVQTLCNVPELIRYATSRLITGQLVGGAVGAVVFLAIGVVLDRRARRGASSRAVQPLD